jgi:diguanylate cyclase (GGDEF)-like protein
VNAVGRAEERKRLAYQATHDALTGLASRAVLRDHVELALARMRRTPSTVAVLFADLDNFKIINDSLGHRVGDALLQEISRRLLGLVRPGDTVARLGGDEFVVLCGDLSGPADAEAVAERLLALLAEAVRVDGHEFFVTASLGIALAAGPDHPPDLLIENADAAMYRAKAKGGNRYRLFDETMRAAASRRLATRTSLRRALQRHDFRVHYQPTVDLVTGQLRGVEALVRWEHPSRGLLPPQEFIPLAEETGLIVPLGTQVLLEACREVAGWRTPGDEEAVELSVNLSPRQFAVGDLVGVVESALAEAGLDPRSLSLEITETCLMEDATDIRRTLRALKDVGVRLAIDDFGTGYSSLSYLRHLPVDTLKLDQSFVRNVAEEGPDHAIASMVMGLGRTLGLKTVAEGIETARQLQTLRALGCDVGQGFLLGRPVPPDELVLPGGTAEIRGGAGHP